MPEIPEFVKVYEYDTRKTGITVPVIIQVGNDAVEINAKIDTGSTYCILERATAELLNIAVESGTPMNMSTATGTFLTYGHRVTLWTLGMATEATVFFIAEQHIRRNILGRSGWLDRVILGLNDYEGKLFLSPYGVEMV